eukprot:CAMPEP_0197864580 /NCGR_PEP_ID=MMETSP1438-20131217/42908_1 /TAXON_ID=1461541 /ORGANISM="Pterosperma sp., Strain CCMP1384" /LENGTH=37 /DNA_ID= /DNA_START= /DNA_END= /DNA_ORIENTATION=
MNNSAQQQAKYAQECTNCQMVTPVVEDRAAGDLICQE